MSKLVNKKMSVQLPYYHEIEKKLEQYAQEGLVLEKVGRNIWSFREAEPQKIKYSIVFFEDGSEYNPRPTERQETYFDYAKEAGWSFVSSYEQMHVFSSTLEEPVPFETDEEEKLRNLNECMWKCIVVPGAVQVAIMGVILLIAGSFIVQQPIYMLESNFILCMLWVFALTLLWGICSLTDYSGFYRKTRKAIDMGMDTRMVPSKWRTYRNGILIAGMILGDMGIFADLLIHMGVGVVSIALLQVPVSLLAFYYMRKLLRSRHTSAKINKVVSNVVMLMVSILLTCLLSYMIISSRDMDAPVGTEIEEMHDRD